jgi:hypothetical protein
MSLVERFRRFWRPAPSPDHPLTAEERDEIRPKSAYDEDADVIEEFVGDDFDPEDERQRD